MVRRSKSKVAVSPERAQDWISSVLNPIIDGLRRESGFLPEGPWYWHHRARRLEYIGVVTAYVAEIYRDNLDDFMAKHRALRARFNAHDQAVARLSKAVEAGFDQLVGPKRDAVFQIWAAHLAQPRPDTGTPPDQLEYDYPYFCSYIAGNVQRLPSNYTLSERYNSDAELRTAAASAIRGELEDARAAGRELLGIVDSLRDRLVEIRTGIADKYGARIRPVDANLGL